MYLIMGASMILSFMVNFMAIKFAVRRCSVHVDELNIFSAVEH